jgi:hypothetical protein
MIEYLSDLETHLEEAEEEGIDLRKERDALLSDDENYMEDKDTKDQEDDDDEGFINDEEEDALVVDLDDEPEVPNV